MLDLTGMRFGKLLVLRKGEIKFRYLYWFCLCDCGVEKDFRGSHLKAGAIRSCGCEGAIKYSHGMTRDKNGIRTKIYGVWQGIKTRCCNPNSYAFKDYGARGITICDEWKNNFQKFYEDMGPTYKVGLTIERKEVNKGYFKENCIWITRSEQANNRRCSIWIETEQGKMTVQQAAKIAGISWPAMYVRVKKNWPINKLLLPRIK